MHKPDWKKYCGWVAIFFASASSVFAASANYSAWTYTKTITFNTTNSGGGANIASNLTNYPMLVRLTSSNFTFSQAMGSGQDLRFEDADNSTALSFQIERWDSTNQVAEVWVRVPQVDGNSSTDYINMYWGKSGSTTASSGSNTFRTADNFVGVWHMAAVSSITDATGSASNGTNGSVTDTTGVVGVAAQFNANNDSITVPHYAAISATNLLVGSSNATWEAWVYPTDTWNSSTSGRRHVMCYGAGTGTNPQNWAWFMDNGNGKLSLEVYNGGFIMLAGTKASWTANQWYHIALVTNGTGKTFKTYVNGAVDNNAGTWTGTISDLGGTSSLDFGQHVYNGNSEYNGGIDEARISNTGRTSDWIALDYATQQASVTCVTYGTATLVTQEDYSTWSNSMRIGFNTTATGANVSTSQTNFPMLIRLNRSNFTFTQANSSGNDLRFIDPDGTKLDYYIEQWTTDSANVWVKVPQVDGNSDQDYITMYWGKSSASAGSSASAVFSTSNNIYGEWDFNSSTPLVDNTGNTGTATNTESVDTSGYIGRGRYFDGVNDKMAITGTNLNTSTFSISGWFQYKTFASSGAWMLGRTNWVRGLGMNTSNATVNGKLYWNETAGSSSYVSNVYTPIGAWNHFYTTTNACGTWYLYINGVQAATGTPGSCSANTNTLYFGSIDAGSSEYANVTLDEMRVENTVRSADWVKLTYETQRRDTKAVNFVDANLSSWNYNTRVYVNTTASGANITANQTNYPLLVRLDNTNFNFSQTITNGNDLRFAKSNGALLPYQIDQWDSTNRVAAVWVRLDTVYANNNTQYFKMYWGKAGAKPLSDGTGVFTESDNWRAVYHLQETGSTTANAYVDASSNAAGTGVATTGTPTASTSVIGKGSDLEYSNAQYHTVTNYRTYDITSSLTVSAWVNLESWAVAYQSIVTKADNAWKLDRNNTSNNLEFVCTGLTTNTTISGTTNLSTATWAYVTAVYDGSYLRLYLNGVSDATPKAATGSISTNSNFMWIGNNAGSTARYWDGILDEVRVSAAARSSDWVKLDYESQKTGSTVVTVGYQPTTYTKSVRFNFNTTATGATLVSSNVTNIPILVRLTSSNFDFSQTTSTGSDLLFIDKDGSKLYHEVMDWDPANKTGNVWVKVPQVDGNSTTDYITLYYGCSSCSYNPQARSDSVWSNHIGVWHLKGFENQANDVSGSGNHGTFAKNISGRSGVTSALAPDFDGLGDSVVVGDVNAIDGATALTVSTWMRTDDLTKDGDIITKGTQAATNPLLFWRDSIASVSGRTRTYTILVCNNSGTSARIEAATNSSSDTSWHYVAMTFTASSATGLRLYIDGVEDANSPVTVAGIAALNSNSNSLMFGKATTNNAERLDGSLQEMRVASDVKSADYIKLSYLNQKANSTLMSTAITTSSFTSSKVFKFNTTASGANIPGDVFNFPLLLRITGSTICDAVQANAPDIRFLDGDGVTWLDYSIERWDQALDSAEVWVKIPKIDGNSNSDFITMYYNDVTNGAIPDGQCTACVFDTANGFVAAMHLNEDGNTTAGGYSDVSGYGNTATGVALTNSSDVPGIIQAGQTFNGTSQKITSTSIPAKMNTLRGSYEFWMRRTHNNTYSTWGMPIDASTGSSSNHIVMYWKGDTFQWRYQYSAGGADYYATVANTIAAQNTWTHIGITWDATAQALKLFVNGSQSGATTTITNSFTTALTSFVLGNDAYAGSDWYQGDLDEVRVSKVARDSNWIKLNYQTQRRDAAPLFNPSPTDFASSTKLTFNTTKTGANVMDSVTNFPLLVRLTNATIIDAVRNDSAADIRFLDGDGKTWLNYQVERWSQAQDSAEIWVNVPQVDGNSATDFITLYYDETSTGLVSNGECSSCVFPTSSGNVAVLHLGANENDATSNANNATNQSTTSVQALIGKGRSFNGSSTYIQMPASIAQTNYTYSAWFKPNSITGTHYILSIQDDRFEIRTNAASIEARHYTAWDRKTSGSSASVGNWTHAAVTYDGTTANIYVNGALSASQAISAISYTGTASSIGRDQYANNNYFDGIIDEVRVGNTALDSSTIKLTYETQRLPSGNKFWLSSRTACPNNKIVLTATGTTTAGGGINLSWPSTVSDSSNADSIGIWVRYQNKDSTFNRLRYPDSANAGYTRVVILPKTDTTYSYPATYPNRYYFGAAVRNTSGVWSPITAASSDTAMISANYYGSDTVYVDSAIGSNSTSCANAVKPQTPLRTARYAINTCTSPTDTMVIRVMPGTYTDSIFNGNTLPAQIVAFDSKSRPVYSGNMSGHSSTMVINATSITAKNLDFKCGTNANSGIKLVGTYSNTRILGNRFYNGSGATHNYDIYLNIATVDSILISDNLFYQPSGYGIYVVTNATPRVNVLNNVFYGAAGSTKGIYYNANLATASWTITNNIFYNWDYGIHVNGDGDNDIGLVSNNLFWKNGTSHDVSGETNTNAVSKDPLLSSLVLTDKGAFQPLPGSPAIDAGISTLVGSGYSQTYSKDAFGNTRPVGAAKDIGWYEGSGYTATQSGEFDTLITTSYTDSIAVKNSKWKIVFKKSLGGGIGGFYALTDTTTNLLAASSTLLDATVNAFVASSQTSTAPTLVFKSKSVTQVRQSVSVSASIDLVINYTLLSSGHIFVESEIKNLTNSSTAITTTTFKVKVGTATSVTTNNGSNNGYGYLATSTRDVYVGTTTDLDTGASAGETWTQSSASGASGYVQWTTANLADPAGYMRRHHHFLIYIGDDALTDSKAATLYADNRNPSPLTIASGSLMHLRSWQDPLYGHWTFDEAQGSTARDMSVNQSNNAALTSVTFTSGMSGAAGAFTTSSVAVVTDNANIEANTNFSLAFWVNPNFASMGTDAYFISKGTSSSDGFYVRRNTSASTIVFRMGSGTVTPITLTTSVWNHVALTVESGQMLAYVNGVLVATGTTNATATANASDLRIGENTGAGAADRFVGSFDDVRLYEDKALSIGEVQAIYKQGFAQKDGLYHVRADNNNRFVGVMNDTTLITRYQPAFVIDNWYAGPTPKYVYLDGTRLTPNVDFISDTVSFGLSGQGYKLYLQLNKVINNLDADVFVDDDDSTGYLGASALSPKLVMSYASGTRLLKVRNFADTTFGARGSNQWEIIFDMNGSTGTTDGDGGIYSWKSSETSPSTAISSATDLTGANQYTLDMMKLDDVEYSSGSHFTAPTSITYTVLDSSATRLRIRDSVTINGGTPTFTLIRTFTVYPTGKIFVSNRWSALSANASTTAVQLNSFTNMSATTTLGYTAASGKAGKIGGSNPTDFNSLGLAMLTVKPGSSSAVVGGSTVASTNHSSTQLSMVMNGYYTTANVGAGTGVYTNWLVDISKDYTDSASLDTALTSEMVSAQLLTAITGSLVTNDATDFNADGYAEGEGAFVYQASSGVAHFKLNATVPRVNPTFKITSWSYGNLPDYVIVDNQSQVLGYHYNAYVDVANSTLILQFNKTFSGGSKNIFISHKTGLAVTMSEVSASGGPGVDTVSWVTQSEFENLGYHVWRRLKSERESAGNVIYSSLEGNLDAAKLNPHEVNAWMARGSGALASHVGGMGNLAKASASKVELEASNLSDTVPAQNLSEEELHAMRYERLTLKPIPGAPDGRSASTRTYRYIDNKVEGGKVYEYLVESIDIHGQAQQFGPVSAAPEDQVATGLQGAFPNPFNPVTILRFSLGAPQKVSLNIYDASGRRVRELLKADRPLRPGRYRLYWDTKNDRGFQAASGPYFYQLVTPGYRATMKMILLK